MVDAEVNLLRIDRGTVIAPAGCGKTQLIAKALIAHQGVKPILVLTHTNAGVAALRVRLDSAGISSNKYRLSTIDGWAIRLISTFPSRSGHDPNILMLATPARDYPAIREAAWRLLQSGHVNDVIAASYVHLIVDEYQDCSIQQHNIVSFLSLILRTCILGDPMQAIFGFKGNELAHWNQHVCAHFPIVAELRTPWRWLNTGAGPLGQWLLQIRDSLNAGHSIDLRTAPQQHVTWIKITVPHDHQQRLSAARTDAPTPDGNVLIIADSRNRSTQQTFASQTPGASTVEAVDLQDLVSFGNSFDIAAESALRNILDFAQSMMTNIGVAALCKRIESLQKGTARNPATDIENSVLGFLRTPSYVNARSLFMALRSGANVRVHRPAIFYGLMRALHHVSSGGVSFSESVVKVREDNRHLGRPLPKRAVGSTLLFKGLEAEMAIILNAEILDSRNLYVAMTRGSTHLVVCSATPILKSVNSN